MHPLLKKLNLKSPEQAIVLKAPPEFREVMAQFPEEVAVKTKLTGVKHIDFAMIFVQKQREIDHWIPKVAPKLVGDAILWMCYPKKSSKNYTCDFNRDTGWEILGQYDLEGVRMVAIDADWSALRFRKVAYIKKLTRKFATLSEAGKKKAAKNN